MLLRVSNVLLTICLLHIVYSSAMDGRVAGVQQQPPTSGASGYSKKIIVTCGDETYTRETVDAAFDRGFEELHLYIDHGIKSKNLIVFYSKKEDDLPYYGISIIHPNKNSQRGIVVFDIFGHIVDVFNQIEINDVRGGTRVEYERCRVRVLK